MERLTEKFTDAETKKNRAYHVIKMPCKVGDKVQLKALCECVYTKMDRDTGVTECPYEDSCEYEECNNANERIFETTVESIFNNGWGWYCTLKDLDIEISLNDFGKTIFLATDADRQQLTT